MIVTGGICNYNLESTAKDLSRPGNVTPGAGVRIVEVSSHVPPTRGNGGEGGGEGGGGGEEKDDGAEEGSDSTVTVTGGRGKNAEEHFLGFSHRYEVV
jgi:hypothetical protein